ncbi:hypothetical protein [Alysiella crassa]|uniref:Alpha-glucan phosphorylase n=1 Tax=Alysiella crassa TaxID=153491 RepID=A0A376BMD9_9NEIS|nr:hypothetical protein [Alysiella crassa]SSY70850.1 Uncharacterised protein [Alysiella crassa]
MNNNIPQVKTVKLLFVAMDEQQQAMFKMAFKMHSTTNYQVIGPDEAGEKPDMVIVDADGATGVAAWQRAKTDYPKSVVVYFSKTPPSLTAPYLSKPIKFDTLFLSLRNLLQGNGVWVSHPSAAAQPRASATLSPSGASSAVSGSHGHAATQHAQQPARAAEVTIPRFDPRSGLLGRFRELLNHNKDTVIVYNDKPVLAVFPAVQRVWVPDSKLLKELCRQEQSNIKVKIISEGSQIQERANATVVSCMWQVAVWTANGRLVHPLNPNTVFRLKYWPNLTRLAPLPESMRLSAFLTKTSVSLNMLYKMMPLDMADILNYIAATYLTDYLTITQQVAEAASASSSQTTMKVESSSHESSNRSGSETSTKTSEAPKKEGLLGRLMRKLLSK